MIITCPDCATTYELPPGTIGAAVRQLWHEMAAFVRTVPDIGAFKPSEDVFDGFIEVSSKTASEEPAVEFEALVEPKPIHEPAMEAESAVPFEEPVLEDIDVKNEAARLARASQSALTWLLSAIVQSDQRQ